LNKKERKGMKKEERSGQREKGWEERKKQEW
jgi:hypothetical protein